jgi:hypothetical protein
MTDDERKDLYTKQRHQLMETIEGLIVNQGVKAQFMRNSKTTKDFRLKASEVEHKLRWMLDTGIPMRTEEALNLKMPIEKL